MSAFSKWSLSFDFCNIFMHFTSLPCILHALSLSPFFICAYVSLQFHCVV
jgi:hypothetical protein